jgi:hypothetical protein
MFTHKIISKEFENGVLVLGVEFTDGVKVITEAVKPQDENGFKYWLNARLESLNSLTELEKLNINDVPDTTPVPPVDKRTAEEKAQETWERQYARLEQAQKLVDLGVTEAVAKRDNMLGKVRTGYLPEYLN